MIALRQAPRVDRSALEDGLARLAPEERAVLELSFRRGLPDAVLAELLGIDAGAVGRRRLGALERLAAEAGASDQAALEAGLRALWAPEGNAAGAAPVARRPPVRQANVDSAEAVAPRRPVEVATGPGRAVRRLAAVSAILASAAAGAAVVWFAVGDRQEDSNRGSARVEPGGGPIVRLGRVGTRGRASGTAQVIQAGGRARVRLWLRGLPRRAGGYGIWLYDAPGRARRLAQFRGSGVRLEVALPSAFKRYRSVDVSAERATAGRRHAGGSVLRVRMRRLLRGAAPVDDGPPRTLKIMSPRRGGAYARRA